LQKLDSRRTSIDLGDTRILSIEKFDAGHSIISLSFVG
jgi:hypothetical protein